MEILDDADEEKGEKYQGKTKDGGMIGLDDFGEGDDFNDIEFIEIGDDLVRPSSSILICYFPFLSNLCIGWRRTER